MSRPAAARGLLSREAAGAAAAREKAAGRRTVFTNGCFDILHAGHVRYLAAAKALGEVLIVGVNTDRSVRALKGEARPVNPEGHRAEVLLALSAVDAVVLFDEPDPGALIGEIMPDVLVKGADWAADKIIGADAVTAAGGKVARIPVLPGVSTTNIIRRILCLESGRSSKQGGITP
jgi:D-beta-D-heptose 7-phosphate kinase/D-beta-D-heptose 1-phosphate adenosyltransferase